MIFRIIKTILEYPPGTVIEFRYPYEVEYRKVSGYLYSCGSFYVLFQDNGMVHMERIGALAVSVQRKGGHKDGSSKKDHQIRRDYPSEGCAAGNRDTARNTG